MTTLNKLMTELWACNPNAEVGAFHEGAIRNDMNIVKQYPGEDGKGVIVVFFDCRSDMENYERQRELQ